MVTFVVGVTQRLQQMADRVQDGKDGRVEGQLSQSMVRVHFRGRTLMEMVVSIHKHSKSHAEPGLVGGGFELTGKERRQYPGDVQLKSIRVFAEQSQQNIRLL